MRVVFKMSLNINNISSKFFVSIHPNMISSNDSRLGKKSDNITDISVRHRYIDYTIDYNHRESQLKILHYH